MSQRSAGTPFSARAFTSLVIALCAPGLPPTGVAMHLLQSDPLPGARHAWMSAHDSLATVFGVFLAWHLVLNRRALAAHLVRPAGSVRRVRRELVWALAVVGVPTALAVGHALVLR
jgi:hypothetical protein